MYWGEPAPRSREVAAELEGGPQPLVGMGRRHADVDHGDVGTVPGRGGQERLAVADGGAHLVATVLERADQAFPEDGGVLDDHDTHGRPAVMSAGAGGR